MRKQSVDGLGDHLVLAEARYDADTASAGRGLEHDWVPERLFSA